MPRVFLGLGSNKGDRLRFLRDAFRKLGATQGVAVQVWSAIYETSAFGFKDQRDFLNTVVGVVTNLNPAQLHAELRLVEAYLGRTPSMRWGPREIDIDLLLYDNVIMKTEALVLPHPGLAERRFVLVPLAEIAGDVVEPRTGKTVAALLEACPDSGTVTRTPWTLNSQQQEHSLAPGK